MSGAVFDGQERSQLRGPATGVRAIVTSRYVLDEVGRVLQDRSGLSADALSDALSGVALDVVPEPSDAAVAEAERVLRDPTDAPVLAAAVLARADAPVTGDKDLHTPEVKRRIRVLTTREALEWLESER